MVNTNRRRHNIVGILVLVTSIGLIAGCTDDLNWSGGQQPPGRSGLHQVRRGVSVDAKMSLVGFEHCESDLSDLEDARREYRADLERRAVREAEEFADERLYDTASAADGAMPADDSSGDMRVDAMAAAPPAESDAGDSGSTATLDSTAGEVVAGTNTVEDDVDEADIIKTDGQRIVTLRDGILRVTVLDDDPGLDGVVVLRDLGSDLSMYLLGDTVTIIGSDPYASSYYYDAQSMPDMGMEAPLSGGVALTQVDISDATAPRIIDSARVQGSLQSTRAVGGRIHAVITSDSPDILPRMSRGEGATTTVGGCEDVRYETPLDDPTEPSEEPADPAQQPAEPAEEPVVRSENPTEPAPMDTTESTTTTTTTDATTPVSPTTINSPTVSILSFTNLSDGIDPTVITGSGGIVYGSTESIYLASPLWDRGADGTAIHRFALNPQGPVDYVGSAVIPGQPLNEFSLSEHDATLRVVTIIEPLMVEPVWSDELDTADIAIAPSRDQRSTRVTTLRTSDMAESGHLDDLAPGESLRAVRFIGTMGYVVTFEQVDPLFAIDLQDPTNPVVLGELEIPGFSEYLHPIGNGLLLGIGRSVDPVSQSDEGLKISLFDVSDPRAPGELDAMTIRDAYSIVSNDHHAFTWDPVRRRAILPVESGCGWSDTTIDSNGRTVTTSEDSPFPPLPSGMCGAAIVVSTDQNQLSQTAMIRHDVNGIPVATPDRAVIVGENIWTLSDAGLGVSPVAAPGDVRLIAFT